MSTRRRKNCNNNSNSGMPISHHKSKQFKQIPSLSPTGNTLPVTNNKVAKKVARLLAAGIIIAIIIIIVVILN